MQLGLMETIRRSVTAKKLESSTVEALSSLLLVDDAGLPITMAKHHILWTALICNPRIKRLLIISPPGSAKTSVVFAYIGAYVGVLPENSVIVSSVSDEVAEKRSLYIRNMVESTDWKKLFPGVSRNKSMKWEQQEWSLSRAGKLEGPRLHPTMRSYGVGASITGSRADLIIADDILDFDNTRTAHQRETVHSWFHNSLLSRLKVDGRVIVIGTSWNQQDLYAQIRAGADGWVICHTPLLSEAEDGFYADITYPDGYFDANN